MRRPIALDPPWNLVGTMYFIIWHFYFSINYGPHKLYILTIFISNMFIIGYYAIAFTLFWSNCNSWIRTRHKIMLGCVQFSQQFNMNLFKFGCKSQGVSGSMVLLNKWMHRCNYFICVKPDRKSDVYSMLYSVQIHSKMFSICFAVKQ